VDPEKALASIETALRLAIRHVLGRANWLQASSAPGQQELEKRQANDNRRDGVVVSNDLLNYAYTRELTGLIEANWDQFEPVFNDKQRTLAHFGVINDVRHAIAHARDLVPFERELISGIAGQLRNQVSLYRSKIANPASGYYPLIESLTDNFGNEAFLNSIPVDVNAPVPRPTRLDVGTELTFSGSAFNVRGKPVKWHMRLELPHMRVTALKEVAEGDSVTFDYVVREREVGELVVMMIYIAADSRYHLHELRLPKSSSEGVRPNFKYDDSAEFVYAVNPPDNED
jgi:hypothetical protein